jgi:hypothetical protein
MRMLNLATTLAFLSFFIGLAFLVAKAIRGDYEKLAKVYPVTAGRAYVGKWISISPSPFGGRNGIQFGANRDGFFMKVVWLFRFGQKPVYVPWDEITVKRTKVWKFFEAFVFSFRSLDRVKMTWYSFDWERARKRFAGVWPDRLLEKPEEK